MSSLPLILLNPPTITTNIKRRYWRLENHLLLVIQTRLLVFIRNPVRYFSFQSQVICDENPNTQSWSRTAKIYFLSFTNNWIWSQYTQTVLDSAIFKNQSVCPPSPRAGAHRCPHWGAVLPTGQRRGNAEKSPAAVGGVSAGCAERGVWGKIDIASLLRYELGLGNYWRNRWFAFAPSRMALYCAFWAI